MHVRPVLALPLALSVVLLTACGTGEDTGDDAAVSAPSVAVPSPVAPSAVVPSAPGPSAPEATAAASPSAAPSPAVRTVDVAYAGGEVTGTSGREEVSLGEQVVLRVSSDVAEEVHVHGYDLAAAVPAAGTVEIPVEATIPGVFEVELHESGKVLFQLRVA